MAEGQKPSCEKIYRRAAELLADRQEGQSNPLAEDQRTLLQDATLSIVTDLKAGQTVKTIEQQMTTAGWQADKAAGFVRLVSQLLSKMYFQRLCIFAGLTFFTGMLSSIAVPMAKAGDFPWLAAVLSIAVAIVSLLGLLRNVQLWRKFRQPR